MAQFSQTLDRFTYNFDAEGSLDPSGAMDVSFSGDVPLIGTLNGAELLGLADELGTLDIGKRASFVVLPTDPLEDLSALRNPEWVVLDGERRAPAEWLRPPLPTAP